MKFNLKSLGQIAGMLIFGAALMLGVSVAVNAQGYDRHGGHDMRQYQQGGYDGFSRDRHDSRQGYNNGVYDRGYGYGQYNNGHRHNDGYYNNGYYNNGSYNNGYYNQPYYNQGYYGNGRYYTPHVDSRNGFRRGIHHALGGH